ncbi:AprI/Inh family metalloprotease inhibitor [Ancylobacter sp. 6x-1]|uniref:AprI/Inh family metalloprotease inhibitor n=1 Tax=Ancylobacter crimeensis TaxID=2579147 RepID=A0ABT0D881_9HYPH|nr:protease inhibitor Inh/omp19 family protein [Ancylobacter crimeensis]MCK0196147.1 AprI/Inh family metalloprotease inhibitor [Ancylobacter crimeensis]
MKLIAVIVVSAGALAIGGCSTSLDGFGPSAKATASPVADADPITPAPSLSVETSAVPAPTGASAQTASAAVTPRETAQAAQSVALSPPPATAPGGVAYADPGATRSQLAGTWTYVWDNGQKTCPLTLSTDRGMSGFAASADVSCPNDIFMTKGWDVWGNDIVLQNHVGKVTARLQPSGSGHFDGVATTDGTKVALNRT